ncbi:MAG TPA: type II and III secretion system protein family protein [Aquabacterium sp.]|uniref:type II and III secretion system protein family protein n=1 Tax=Aquabacterium sp. TaxID=1872578 RepID=UPI002E31A0FF|nr:type II and III secretion system protein family protein [Aquabacterium sp.]HEX5372297.1 type II and III secretion system protein family protein [Aquabacterium sp.]
MKRTADHSRASFTLRTATLWVLSTLVTHIAVAADTEQLAANTPATKSQAEAKAEPAKRTTMTPQTAKYSGQTEMAPPLQLTVGKSSLVRLPSEASRLSVGNPDVADVMLINPREIYILGKKIGATNMFVWTRDGRATVMDLSVGVDTSTLKHKLTEFVPSEPGVTLSSLGDSVVLTGRVSDALKAHRLVQLAEVYAGNKKVVNLLRVDGSQQVMLEVKVAEVSKTLLDKLGVQFSATRTIGNTTVTMLSDFLSGGSGSISTARPNGRTSVTLDAEVQKGLVKILAEPTITAVSGQEGSFLAGGKIFIAVPSGTVGGLPTLEEREFGVGLRFTPTVLEDGLINLNVTPEVSELGQVESSGLPTITTRRASTTVQLRDGETFAIGGLIKNNVTEGVKALPVLGELPVLGALFRSSEFQTDRSELLFIVTPRLAKPLPANYSLPTDNFTAPSRAEFLLNGRMEGDPKTPAPAKSDTAAPQQAGGFQVK